MVIVTLILSVAATAFVAKEDGSETEPRMRQTHLPPISSITIRTSGATSAASGASSKQCAAFKLSPQEIRAFIGKAGEVAEHDYFHMLDWSPCYIGGEVVFKNGATGTWAIQQYRAGSLQLSDGQTLYLYCPACHARAFPPLDD